MKELKSQELKPLVEKAIPGEIREKPKMHFMGREQLKKGHKVWRLDTETGEISEFRNFKAKLVPSKAGDLIATKEIHRVGNRYAYVLCLNKKNAYKKFINKGHKNVIKPWVKK